MADPNNNAMPGGGYDTPSDPNDAMPKSIGVDYGPLLAIMNALAQHFQRPYGAQVEAGSFAPGSTLGWYTGAPQFNVPSLAGYPQNRLNPAFVAALQQINGQQPAPAGGQAYPAGQQGAFAAALQSFLNPQGGY